jgi:BlaI family penicillinase repressor
MLFGTESYSKISDKNRCISLEFDFYYYICSSKTIIVVMKDLTKAEEQLMKYLWKLEKGYMKDLVDAFPEPKPAYTTIATLLTRMIDKGYVDFVQRGKVREYFPKLKKSEYVKSHFNQIIQNFFNNSTAQFASFFTARADLSLKELEELRSVIQEQIEEKKKK